MELKNIFDTALAGFQHETRSYNRKIEPNEFTPPPVARFKAVIYLKNNKSLWYYSYDFTKTTEKNFIDEQKGLMKLCRLINGKQGQFKTAIIYANLDPRPIPGSKYDWQIVKFNSNNTYIERPFIHFIIRNEHCLLDLQDITLTDKTIKN